MRSARPAAKAAPQLRPRAREYPLDSVFGTAPGIANQCGVCTPGFLVAAKALLDHNPDPTEHDIRFSLANNLCRCTGYDKIVKAVQAAARELQSLAK